MNIHNLIAEQVRKLGIDNEEKFESFVDVLELIVVYDVLDMHSRIIAGLHGQKRADEALEQCIRVAIAKALVEVYNMAVKRQQQHENAKKN